MSYEVPVPVQAAPPAWLCSGSARLHTTWIPLQDTPMELGGLAVCQGSHRLPGFARLQETYGKLDVERDGLDGTGASRADI